MDRPAPAAARLSPFPGATAARGAHALPRWAPLLIVFLIAIVLRPIEGTNVDVSWLITIGEKMLAGERLYTDILEVNPPASAFLYLAPIMLAHAVGLSPEMMVGAFVMLGAALSLWMSGVIVKRSPGFARIDGWMLAAATAAVLTILPAYAFAQREHVAVMTLLPFLALLAIRVDGEKPTLAGIAVAGIGAGITIVIKPHFCVAVGLGILAAAWGARSWRMLFAAENWIAAAVAAVYGALVVVAYPVFVAEVVPLVQTIYLPVRENLAVLLVRPPVLCWLAALRILSVWEPGSLWTAPYSLLTAPSVGFLFAYLVQGKGWPYHSYPMLALLLIALSLAWLRRRSERKIGSESGPRFQRIAVALVLPGLFAACFVWFNLARHTSGLAEPIRALKTHPRMLMISSDLAVGHPLVRELGGTWVARPGHLWVSAGAFHLLTKETPDEATKAELRRLAAEDRDNLVEDIERGKPDIIVVDRRKFDWMAWARWDPRVSSALTPYREARTLKGFVILQRSDQAPSGATSAQ